MAEQLDVVPLIVNALLIGLFFIAIVSFGIQVGLDNDVDPERSLLTDQTINNTFYGLERELNTSQSLVENQSRSQDENDPIAVFDFLFKSVVGAGVIFKSLFRNIYNVTIGFIAINLGVPDLIVTTLTAILLLILIFSLWRRWKRG